MGSSTLFDPMSKDDALRDLQRTWNELGKSDPLWAILAEPDKRGNRWNPDAFFETGVKEIDRLLRDGTSLGLPEQRRRALDFGCGAGRLTQALAGKFDEVCGVDIAPSMIEVAREHNRHGDRCRYLVNDASDLRLFEDGRFDFIVTVIVLQHIDPQHARGYIRELVRVLAPGGLLIFQVPDRRTTRRPLREIMDRVRPRVPPLALRYYRAIRGAIFQARSRITGAPPPPWEMHGVPRGEVERIVGEGGGRVVRCDPSGSAGPGWVDFRYYVTR
jgi:SAM-dependent methyltransferase